MGLGSLDTICLPGHATNFGVFARALVELMC